MPRVICFSTVSMPTPSSWAVSRVDRPRILRSSTTCRHRGGNFSGQVEYGVTLARQELALGLQHVATGDRIQIDDHVKRNDSGAFGTVDQMITSDGIDELPAWAGRPCRAPCSTRSYTSCRRSTTSAASRQFRRMNAESARSSGKHFATKPFLERLIVNHGKKSIYASLLKL